MFIRLGLHADLHHRCITKFNPMSFIINEHCICAPHHACITKEGSWCWEPKDNPIRKQTGHSINKQMVIPLRTTDNY